MEYGAWVTRAEVFVKGLPRRVTGFSEVEVTAAVAPPLSEAELEAVQRALPLRIPTALRRFWSEGSRHCSCRYVCWDVEHDARIFGGASFLDALELPSDLPLFREWAEHTWIDGYPEEERLWLESLPFFAMDNGDYLGVDLGQDPDEPPVIYLAHDDHSFTLAPTFTAFLETWERVGYIGPEVWMLEGLLDGQKRLDAGTERARELRLLFGLA